ncbi:MAG: hypothetical protein ACI4LT_01975 [Treponema sp.]
MAPTTMSNPDGKKRVKTDRIDARAIARILAYKSYSQVHLPSEEKEMQRRECLKKQSRNFFLSCSETGNRILKAEITGLKNSSNG